MLKTLQNQKLFFVLNQDKEKFKRTVKKEMALIKNWGLLNIKKKTVIKICLPIMIALK